MRTRVGVLVVLAVLTAGIARAGTITLSGYFDDDTNAALRWSDLGGPLFGNDGEIANNVALYEITVPVAGAVRFQSAGYGVGGAQPYLSVFGGTLASPGTATLVTSSYWYSDIDFDFTEPLAAGSYVVALSVFFNMSFAENGGSGALSDGFVQLGTPEYLGNGYYELGVTVPEGTVVPEPSSLLLLALGLGALGAARRRS